MNVIHRITGYDKRTEKLAFEFDIPDDKLGEIYELAHVPAMQKERFGSFPLDERATGKIASHLAIHSDDDDGFFEPFAL